MTVTVDPVPTGVDELDRSWRVNPQVSVRPEPFGALVYHFGTRRLSFLKSPELATIVGALEAHPSARAACAALAPAGEQPAYEAALRQLARTDTIVEVP